METVLTTHQLSKHYGSHHALKGISLKVEQGSVFGLLGPNGSGKTTTLGILLDIIPQNKGSYTWFGQKPSHQLRKQIGSILETPNFYGYLSAERNLKISAEIKEVPFSDIDRVLKMVKLFDRRKDKFKSYSLGMKQRLSIAAALLGKPQVLLLDEPTNGLDPQGIAEIRELIIAIAEQGVTIILASHMLDEVEKVCSHVAIIKNGSLIVQGRVDEILDKEPTLELKADDMDLLLLTLKEFALVKEVKLKQGSYLVKLSESISNAEINTYCFNKGVPLTHLVSKKKKLETHFLEITN
ncbi:MAG: ATP-binding cassette domain-containing protein [Flavobacteriales bacterium]|nr:ATP-binding cassette domain-containing protein [Flavobacteriales bacterium]